MVSVISKIRWLLCYKQISNFRKCCLLIALTLIYIYGGLHILLSLPFSQFTYPLEADYSTIMNCANTGSNTQCNLNKINNPTFTTVHQPHKRCQKQKYDLLILIKSASYHRTPRSILRSTWLTYHKSYMSFTHVFVLGLSTDSYIQKQVANESKEHQDILQFNFIDHYYNNTYKIMKMVDWASEFCPAAKFILFCDDDIFVNLPRLHSLLHKYKHEAETNFAVGHVFSTSIPKRSIFDRWYISLSEYPFLVWPPYLAGGAFLVSRKLLTRISQAQKYVKYLRFDDVFLGIVMKKLRVDLVHSELFAMDTGIPLKMSTLRSNIAVHFDRHYDLLQDAWGLLPS